MSHEGKPMTEGNLYPCSWKRVRGRYRVWLTADPTVVAEHANFEAADELLVWLIHDATGDGENIHAYDPPEPRSTPPDSTEQGELWTLGKEAIAYIADAEPYFAEGLCDNCLKPRGARTVVPLHVTKLKSGVDASMVKLATAGFTGPTLTIVSKAFLSALTAKERSCFEWRPIEHNLRTGVFFEVIHRVPPVRYVGAKGHSNTYYGRCKTCKFEWVITHGKRGKPDSYVSERDLPVPPRPLLAVGPMAYATLAVSRERWTELVGKPGMRGIKGSPVAIIAESAVERRPRWQPREREGRKPPVSAAYKALVKTRRRKESRLELARDYAPTHGEELFEELFLTLDGAVQDGGVRHYLDNPAGDGYFDRPAGDGAENAKAYLAEIGAWRTLALLDDISTLFPDGLIPSSLRERVTILKAAAKHIKKLNNALREADVQYHAAQQELYARLATYVKANLQEFPGPPKRS